MGIIWRHTMPLMTTLAALVLIVHTAEEDLESEYRHDLRPRILDTRTPSYDQSWRAMEAEPIMQPAQNDNWDNKSLEELPKRRRPGRKRKRRPQTSSTEDIGAQERYPYPDEPPRPYFDVTSHNVRQTTEMPRRRKIPDARPIRWTDDAVDFDRPLRRRNQRRKRPLLEPWPKFTEFSGFRPEDTLHKEIEEYTPAKQTNGNDDDNGKDFFVELNNERELTEKSVLNQEHVGQEQKQPFDDSDDDLQYRRGHLTEDKSLSEFSAEIMNSNQGQKVDSRDGHESGRDKSFVVLNEYDKAQDKCLCLEFSNKILGKFVSLLKKYDDEDITTNYYILIKRTVRLAKTIEKNTSIFKHKLKTKGKSIIVLQKCKDKVQLTKNRKTLLEIPKKLMDQLNVENYHTDPLSLKDILKRSNGTSLSEILQQHNLSLTDLLHGKENAVSILKSQTLVEPQISKDLQKTAKNVSDTTDLNPKAIHKDSEEKELLNSETKYAAEPIATTLKEYPTTTEEMLVTKKDELYTTTTSKPIEDNVPKIVTKRRYPPGLRKKLRLRPMLNNTFKPPLSPNPITLNSRKYSHHRRNITKFRQWKDIVPAMNNYNTSEENTLILEAETTTTENVPDETTLNFEIEANTDTQLDLQTTPENKIDDINMDVITTTEVVAIKVIQVPKNATKRPSVVSMPRPTAISSGLKRQAFNNRLKRKRMKFKNSTTEPPQDDIIKHLFGMGNLVSSSEFIARTQEPENTDENSEEHTTLKDFINTESTSKSEGSVRHTNNCSVETATSPMSTIYTTTEETAKIEIEEILNDTQTSANLSRILQERNMTLSELVEHRERGSSHVHLADIFHNASREPNPPEPFLSKSLIEPISKETYPLRALLDANSHEPIAKQTIDPSMIQISNVNIPVVMDFRNNVNENAENMGIMSLFNNFTKHIYKSPIMKDSEGSPYETSIIALNTTHENSGNAVRESRILAENFDDVVSWNEIFSLMRKNQKNDTGSFHHTEVTQIPYKKISLDDDDADGDGFIVLEDLQHLKESKSNIGSGSDEKLEARTFERTEVPPLDQGILERIPSQTKSVTVATASIAGLAMILFLLTYALFKWREQRLNIRKKNSFCDERIQTPVFENRKGHKNNSSMRSISPMLQTSNIYTLNTLDSKAGKESPDYMWDSLRKPFQ